MIKYIFITLFFFFNSCSTGKSNMFTNKDYSKTLLASYDKVWDASINEISKYPLNIADKKTGTIVTEPITKYIKINKYDQINKPITIYFYLTITPISLAPYKTKISITKYSKLANSERNIGTNLVDEKVIMYRIKRNLILERQKIEALNNGL